MNALLTVVSGEQEIDLTEAPALCQPLIDAGLVESWRPAITVEGITLILPEGETREKREELIQLIHMHGLCVVEEQ
jgi:hypothetical protein